MELEDQELYRSLTSHLEQRYSTTVKQLARLQRGNPHVHRVERADGGSWVARVFGADRPIERVEGDAAILRLLEKHDYPAERVATRDPVSVLDDGRSVLVTEYIEGSEPDGSLARTQGALAELLGRLTTIPCDAGPASRAGGAWGADPKFEGRPSQDLAMARARLSLVDGRVPLEYRDRYDSLCRQVEAADDLEGLPEALVHPDPAPVNARLRQDDGSMLFIDWTSVGRGPRISVLGWFLGGVSAADGYDAAKLNAVVEGYCSHVQLNDEELARLPGAMHLRGLLFACMYFSQAIAAERPLRGPGLSWATDEELARSQLITNAIRTAIRRV